MTLGEFKAWLDGFGAAINGAPTQEQWETIKTKLAEVQDTIPAPPVFSPFSHPQLPPSPSIGRPWWLSPVIGDVTCQTGGIAQ